MSSHHSVSGAKRARPKRLSLLLKYFEAEPNGQLAAHNTPTAPLQNVSAGLKFTDESKVRRSSYVGTYAKVYPGFSDNLTANQDTRNRNSLRKKSNGRVSRLSIISSALSVDITVGNIVGDKAQVQGVIVLVDGSSGGNINSSQVTIGANSSSSMTKSTAYASTRRNSDTNVIHGSTRKSFVNYIVDRFTQQVDEEENKQQQQLAISELNGGQANLRSTSDEPKEPFVLGEPKKIAPESVEPGPVVQPAIGKQEANSSNISVNNQLDCPSCNKE